MKEQRKHEILKYLNEKGRSDVHELEELLGVSQSTVRRDLSELSRSELIAFKRDGIVPLPHNFVDKAYDLRSAVNAHAKSAIARAAIKLINEGSCIFLDSSTTVLAMTPALRSFKNITVVTNSLNAARRLRDCPFSVYLIGGEISIRSLACYGPVTEAEIKKYNFDTAFFSPVAVTPNNFAAETTENAASVRRAALAQSRESVLLCDHTKLGLTRPYNFARLDAFSYIITDDDSHVFDTGATVRRVREKEA